MKKTTFKSSLIAIALLLTGTISLAQQADIAEVVVAGWGRETQDLSKLPKMEKDIVILQNVLSDLFSNSDRTLYSSRNAKGMYVPGSGVIFSMSGSGIYGSVFSELVIDRDIDRGEKEVDVEELNQKSEEDIRNKSKEFLTNYGSLLTELKSGEKLMLNVDYSLQQSRETLRNSGNRVAYTIPRSNKQRMQSSISYKTLNDFSTGKINLQQAMAAVETKIVEDADKDMTDAKILAGILDDLMQSSMDGKFKRRSRTTWSYFDGFGLMFNIQMGTQVSSGMVVYSQGGSGSRVINRSEAEKEREENLKELEEAYPEFENMLKENIVQYGRTLRSLGSNESVIVNVDFGGYFSDSKLPRSIRMIVPKSSIEAYAKGQKSLEQVKKEIDIKQLQTSIGGSSTFIYGNTNEFFPAIDETAPKPPTPAAIGLSGTRSKSNR